MANKKAPRRRVSTNQSKRRQEEARKEQEQFRNRVIAGVAGFLLIVVLVFFVFQLRGATQEETAASGDGLVGEGTLIEGDRPLAAIDPADRDGYYDAYPEMIIDQSKTYEAVIHTEKGDMLVRLFDEEAPLAVNNFVFLATQGFYDNVVFHRVLDGFMAQGGDPLGTGQGGPGYQFDNEVSDDLTFDRPHLLAMANAGPDTNGSQFFITFVETLQLSGGYTIFGELLQGEDALNSITFIDPDNPADNDRVGDTINSIDIYES